jgi:hypothetical protein
MPRTRTDWSWRPRLVRHICGTTGACVIDSELTEYHLGGLLRSFGKTVLEWVHEGTTITATINDDRTISIKVGSDRPMYLEMTADHLYWAVLAKYGVPEPRRSRSLC